MRRARRQSCEHVVLLFLRATESSGQFGTGAGECGSRTQLCRGLEAPELGEAQARAVCARFRWRSSPLPGPSRKISGLARTGRPERSATKLSHTFTAMSAMATNGKAKSQNAAAPAVNAGSRSRLFTSEFSGDTSEPSRELAMAVVFMAGQSQSSPLF